MNGQNSWPRQVVRQLIVLVAVFVAYVFAIGLVYVLIGRLTGWPIVEEENEVALRVVHLVPSLLLCVIAAGTAGAFNVVNHVKVPATGLALAMALTHYFSYAPASRTTLADISAAACESLLLAAAAFACYCAAVAIRRGRI